MKANQTDHKSSVFIPLILFASVLSLIAFVYFWPTESPRKKIKKVSTNSQSSIKPKPSVPTPPPELIAPQKRDSPARKGLGASLADSPIPKASSRLNLPKDLNLGEHLIQLKGGEWRLRIMLTLSSESPEFVRFASPLKRRLIQMLFFLVHHRAPEALRMPSAEERLRADLMTRFANVLKQEDFEMYIDTFSLEEVELTYE